MNTAVIPELTAVAMLINDDGEFLPVSDEPGAPNQEAIVEAGCLEADPAWIEPQLADAGLWLYRERTVGLLRRYLRMSVEVGRLPSLLGREFFRSRVTSYKASTFEDAVIFVHDVERSLEKLGGFEQKLIATIVLQEYSRWEAARILNCGMRTIGRLLPEALDCLTEIFLEGGRDEILVRDDRFVSFDRSGGSRGDGISCEPAGAAPRLAGRNQTGNGSNEREGIPGNAARD